MVLTPRLTPSLRHPYASLRQRHLKTTTFSGTPALLLNIAFQGGSLASSAARTFQLPAAWKHKRNQNASPPKRAGGWGRRSPAYARVTPGLRPAYARKQIPKVKCWRQKIILTSLRPNLRLAYANLTPAYATRCSTKLQLCSHLPQNKQITIEQQNGYNKSERSFVFPFEGV